MKFLEDYLNESLSHFKNNSLKIHGKILRVILRSSTGKLSSKSIEEYLEEVLKESLHVLLHKPLD